MATQHVEMAANRRFVGGAARDQMDARFDHRAAFALRAQSAFDRVEDLTVRQSQRGHVGRVQIDERQRGRRGLGHGILERQGRTASQW
jgi:hypothetical protein